MNPQWSFFRRHSGRRFPALAAGVLTGTLLILLAGAGSGNYHELTAKAQPTGGPSLQDPGREKRPAGTRENEQQDPGPGQISTLTVNVRLPITVSDSKTGRFVVDLKQQDFEVLEDREVQKIESFLSQTELPLDIAVLMDTSNSVKPKL